MANIWLIGPLPFDFGPDGLSPGQSIPTFWTTEPSGGAGTVTFTAFPRDFVNGTDGARLAIRDPTIDFQLSPIGSPALTLHAIVANVGENIVFTADMYISIVD